MDPNFLSTMCLVKEAPHSMGTFNEPNYDKKVFNSSPLSTYGACGLKIFY